MTMRVSPAARLGRGAHQQPSERTILRRPANASFEGTSPERERSEARDK